MAYLRRDARLAGRAGQNSDRTPASEAEVIYGGCSADLDGIAVGV